MTYKFFSNTHNQSLIEKKLTQLSSIDSSDLSVFCKERNVLISGALNLFLKNASIFDDRAQFNTTEMGDAFLNELASPLSEDNLNIIFTSCLRFFMEENIFQKEDFFQLSGLIKDFAIYRKDEFDERAATQITYALTEMPLNMLRKMLTSDNAKSYREYIERAEHFEKSRQEWDAKLEDSLSKSQALNESLVMQLNKFNFVGLYKGFAELGDKKIDELKRTKWLTFGLGFIIPIPLLIESVFLFYDSDSTYGWPTLAKTIPTISLTLILIYFFRIALTNFNSVKAQLIQIDLRKSLCQFIQNYAEYAKDIKTQNSDLLNKFEEVIFSNIMPSVEKIPATFDGLEQVASLISALKK
ncbi:hypothetical protein GWD52_13840 [Enterobacteriaceae bacterium 4M9]|nr:hypothetical protein [Enterobacteriaceae bacterium 4M9]